MDPKQKPNNKAVQDNAETLQKQGRGPIHSDILGSYTGTPEDGEMPEQDADDL